MFKENSILFYSLKNLFHFIFQNNKIITALCIAESLIVEKQLKNSLGFLKRETIFI